MSFLAPIAGAVVGGLMSDSGGGQQTASKEPWEPARQPLIDALNTGQDLQRYYQQTPFNPLQQTGYQNLYSDLDGFRNQVAPGLMDFANRLMGTNYQRSPDSNLGALEGLLSGSAGSTAQRPQQGLLSQAGPFAVPQGQSYGLLDFTQLNPFTADNGIPKTPVAEKPAEKTPAELAQEEWERLQRTGMGFIGAGA